MILYGARGQAKVIYDLILSNNHLLEYLVDDNPPSDFPHQLPIFLPTDDLLKDKGVIIAVGNNGLRAEIANKIGHLCQFETMIHRTAYVSRFAVIGEGTVIMPNASINAEVNIGKHCIINTNAVIEHESYLEDYVHISPSAALAGNIKIKEGAQVGLGAKIIQGVTIGSYATVGAGAVVIADVPDFAVVVGNPAKIIKYHPMPL